MVAENNAERHRKIEDLDVPGLTRGFPKRETIEQKMERSMGRIRAGMPGEKAHLLVIGNKNLYFFDLPSIVSDKKMAQELWVPRYHRVTGAVITTKWDKALTRENEDGKQEVNNAELFHIFRQPWYRKNVDLTALPKKWRVARLIPQEVWGGIETAMRQQDIIKREYDPKEGVAHSMIEELFVAMRGFLQKFDRGEVTSQNLEDFARQTEELLEREGVLSARDPYLAELRETLSEVFQRDKMGRINLLVSKMRIYKVMLNLTKREVENWLARSKSSRVFDLLYSERKGERFSLQVTRDSIEKLGGFDEAYGHPVLTDSTFRNNPMAITNEDIHGIRDTLKVTVENGLQQARMAPYLLPAKLSEAILRSNVFRKKHEIRKLREVLEIGGVEKEVDRPSVEDLIMQRKAFEARRRLHHAFSVLGSVLTDPDHTVYRVYDQ